MTAATRTVAVAGAYAVVGGLVSFLGWAVDVPALTAWGGAEISIQPNTTVAAMAAGAALLVLAGGRRRPAAVLGVLVGLIGVASLFENVSGVDVGIDTLLMFGRTWGRVATVAPGRIGVPSSVSWALTGAALGCMAGGPRLRAAVPPLGIAVTGIAALSLIGRLFGADPLYTVPWLTAIAAQTSSMLLAVGLGLIAAVPERQPMHGVLEDSAAGVLTRRALPFIVLIPLLFALARLRGERAGFYDTAMGTAIMVLTLIGFLCWVLWWSASAVRRHERAASELTARLETSIRELEAVFRAAPVGIAVARDAGCTQVHVNAAFAAMLGTPELANASLTGPDAARLPFRVLDEHGARIPPAELPLQRAARAAEFVSRIIVIERADGSRVTATAAAVPVAGARGVDGAILVVADVTAERRAAAEREELLAIAERARAEAETANRAKDDFLATVSHELRSPLQGVLSWITLLRRGRLDPAKAARALEAVERSVGHQAQLVQDLMDVSRVIMGKLQIERERVDVASLVARTGDEFAPAAAARGLTLDVQADPCGLVVGDHGRLHQVLANLLGNALKFTPAGGRVQLSCGRDGDDVVLTVADTGEGIPPEFLPRLFDRFTQADTSTTRRHGGLGIGLAIVRHLVALHGGTVAAASPGRDQGATFTVRLPGRSDVEALDGMPDTSRPGVVRLDGVEVLLVEDDDDVLEAMRHALAASGARVRAASSAGQAWDACRARRPDVVVSDLGMPGEDGYSLLRRIRALPGDGVPAVAMTGFARPEDRAHALAAGFAAHVAKPIDPDELVRVVAALLRRGESSVARS